MANGNNNVELRELELKIQRMLLDFYNRTGCEIDHVTVDTRNFANLKVEIHVKEKR